MSRVDDDRDAARTAERIALQKRNEDKRSKEKAGESAFAKLVQQQKAQAQKPAVRTGDSAPAPHPDSPPPPGSFGSKIIQASLGEKGRMNEQQAAQGRQKDQGVQKGKAESRKEDAKVTDKALKERSDDAESSLTGLEALSGGRGAKGGGEVRADADGGGGGGSGDKDGKGGSEAAAGFRFNPALMAPVPVAKPKDAAGSAKLRALAEEIAQKIVERARIGTNAAGQAEMQIDLRSNVLKGLSIKLSCSNGKIRATFSGQDKEVMKLLRDNQETLRATLEKRGLRLEEYRVEDRA